MSKKLLIGICVFIVIVGGGLLFLQPSSLPNGSMVTVTDGNETLPLPQLAENARYYNLQAGSIMQWTGRKIGGYNNGTVSITKGAFGVDDTGTAAGKFVIDMNSIKILDMSEDNMLYDTLLEHLRTGFFAVDNYPTVTFDLKQAVKKSGGVYTIVGDLTMRGVTREISFPAQVNITEDSMIAKANFFVDRTARGIDEVIQIADKYIQFGVDLVFDRK